VRFMFAISVDGRFLIHIQVLGIGGLTRSSVEPLKGTNSIVPKIRPIWVVLMVNMSLMMSTKSQVTIFFSPVDA